MNRSWISRPALVVLAVISAAIAIVWITIIQLRANSASVSSGLLIGLGSPVVVAILALAIEPVRKEIQQSFAYVVELMAGEACRIFVFGRSRSGKTTLVSSLVAVDQSLPRTETKDFTVYELRAPVRLNNVKHINLKISDYRGEQSSQVLVNHDPAFFGADGNRRINALIFIVDMFPEEIDEHGNALDNDKLAERYGKDAEKVIEKRVEGHYQYLSPQVIGCAFTLCFNKDRLIAVRLLVNKIDLLDNLVKKGYLILPTGVSAENYAEQKYADLFKILQRYCAEANISDRLESYTISATQSRGTGRMFAKMFNTYLGP